MLVEIEEIKKKGFYYKIILGVFVSLLPIEGFFLLKIFNQIMNEAFIGVIFLQVLFVIIIILIFIKHFKINYPFYTVKFLISEEKFEIYLYSQLFKDFLWKDITKIELINETLGLLSRSGRYLYKMKIYNINGFQEIRLYLLRFKKKQLKNNR